MATVGWKAPVEGAAGELERTLWSRGRGLPRLQGVLAAALVIHGAPRIAGCLGEIATVQGTGVTLTSVNVKTDDGCWIRQRL